MPSSMRNVLLAKELIAKRIKLINLVEQDVKQ